MVKVAHLWDCPALCAFATSRIRCSIDCPFQLLLLAREYGLDDWVTDALEGLIKRDTPLSLSEIRRMLPEDIACVTGEREARARLEGPAPLCRPPPSETSYIADRAGSPRIPGLHREVRTGDRYVSSTHSHRAHSSCIGTARTVSNCNTLADFALQHARAPATFRLAQPFSVAGLGQKSRGISRPVVSCFVQNSAIDHTIDATRGDTRGQSISNPAAAAAYAA